MRYIHITNWQDHQHYKDRRPKWIKLLIEIIDEFDGDGIPKKFYHLPDSAKLTFVLLACLRANFNGNIPYPNDEWLKLKTGITTLDMQPLIEAKFIVIVSSPSASDTVLIQDCTKPLPPETKQEQEREREQETKTKGFDFAISSDGIFNWLEDELKFETSFEKNTFRKYSNELARHKNFKDINAYMASLIQDCKLEVKEGKTKRENMMKIVSAALKKRLGKF